MKPRVSERLKARAKGLYVIDRGYLRPIVHVFREARDIRVGVGRGVGIVLVVVLNGDDIPGAGIPVEIGDSLIGSKGRGPRQKRIVG